MNEKLYQEWIDALESGDYEDGRLYLRYDGDNSTLYCCLGVLCELSELGAWTGERVKNYSVDNKEAYSTFLPPELMQEISFRTPDGDFNLSDLTDELLSEIIDHVELAKDNDIDEAEEISLVEINDGFMPHSDSDTTSSFKLIAKVLRESPESLFKNE